MCADFLSLLQRCHTQFVVCMAVAAYRGLWITCCSIVSSPLSAVDSFHDCAIGVKQHYVYQLATTNQRQFFNLFSTCSTGFQPVPNKQHNRQHRLEACATPTQHESHEWLPTTRYQCPEPVQPCGKRAALCYGHARPGNRRCPPRTTASVAGPGTSPPGGAAPRCGSGLAIAV